MDDIQVISGNIAYDSIQVLSSTLDRIDAINYHCESIENCCSLQEFRKAKWHFRGALTEFRSLFDVIKHDLKEIQLYEIWNKADSFNKNLHDSVLIKILKKTRDLAVHTSHVNGVVRKFQFKSLDSNGERRMSIELIFIDPIDKKYSRELGSLTDEEIAWFDRQIQFWPAHFIIKEAVYIMYVELRNFLTVNGMIPAERMEDL